LSIAFILWFSISLFLVGFWVWTSWILFQQKKAWKLYAQKRKLRYNANKFYDSPEVGGSIEGYKVKIFPSTHITADARGERHLTTIEVSLLTGVPVDAAIASGGMVKIVDELDLSQEFRPEIKGWDDSYIVRSRDNHVLRSYLIDERVKALIKLMELRNAWVILIFAGGDGLLRIDTPDPLQNPKSLDDMVKKMIEVARILELGEGEARTLKSKRTDNKKAVLDVGDNTFDGATGLELEDDEGAQPVSEDAPKKK